MLFRMEWVFLKNQSKSGGITQKQELTIPFLYNLAQNSLSMDNNLKEKLIDLGLKLRGIPYPYRWPAKKIVYFLL